MRNTINDTLVKEYTFDDFVQAWKFLEQVATIAEKHQHHPEIWNVYNKVKLTLTTHDAGDIVTEKDQTVAAEIDKIVV